MIKELVHIYGSQSIVASIDFKVVQNEYKAYISNGTKEVTTDLIIYLKNVQDLGVGEIYLNSIDRDGTGFGYDLESINYLANYTKVPLIIAGGAGNEKHLLEGLNIDEVSAVATANLFNFIGEGLPNARQYILNNNQNISIRINL